MKPVHLILAKHADSRLRGRVYGEAFASSSFSRAVSGNPSGRFGVILEDNFIGNDLALQGDSIRADGALRTSLAIQTKGYREYLRSLARLVEHGVDGARGIMSPLAVTEKIIDENRNAPGRVLLRFSATCEEAQLLTIESFFWKNRGYMAAFFEGDEQAGIRHLADSIRIMARAVVARDILLVGQVCALSESVDAVIVLQGSNHRNLASALWPGLSLQVHAQPDDPLPFYDEALVRLLGPRPPDDSALAELMRKELAFHMLFFPLVQSCSGAFVEDMIRECRDAVESNL